MKKRITKTPKIIVDTDAGHDDVLAIMLLIKSKLFDIQAITTVAGNSTLENATRNAKYTLELLGSLRIPIYSGSSGPLSRKLVKAVVHGDSGLDGASLKNIDGYAEKNAIDEIKSLIMQSPSELTILTLGPLTNIAKLLKKYPKTERYIKNLVIMGGAINVCGNKNRVAEFNMFVDPEAADIVFRSKVNKLLVPLDPCNDIIIPLSDFERLKGSEIYSELKSMMSSFIHGIAKHEGVNGALVYDALAAYYLINSSAFITNEMDILIETKGEHTSGMTVAEKRLVSERNQNVEVVSNISKEDFLDDFFTILGSDICH